MRSSIAFLKKNTVLCIAALAALITALFVRPDEQYIGYFDFRTLTCLFCMLAVIGALRNIGFFSILASRIVKSFGNTRACITALVFITYGGSMLIANDMALLTFLPLGYCVLSSTGKHRYMAYTFILQNIAANLGGMLTPFGNPQNLFLYSKFNIPTNSFLLIMLPPFIVSLLLIALCCAAIKKEPISVEKDIPRLDRKKSLLYSALFVYSILIVFRVFPYWTGLIVIPAVLLFFDRRALLNIDYPLLLTFACFFVFAGNMGRIPAVRAFFGSFLENNTLICGVLSCQVISNVPSAILLSQFTEDYRSLLAAVNIGGVGTLISSLASLITFREYCDCCPGRGGYFLLRFSLLNFGFLIILTLFMLLWNGVIA